MVNPIVLYCYDAYCGWCYGFSPVMKLLQANYKGKLDFEVLSGGMILPEQEKHISSIAPYIQQAYKRVEELTGIKFGKDFLWHIFNPDKSDWFLNSEKPAIALSIFKEYYPEKSLDFASDLQYALNFEGRDLTDNEAYRHLLEKYGIPVDDFYLKLSSETYKDKAHYEFMLCKHLKVNGFPAVFLQTSPTKVYAIANGYTDYDTLTTRLENVLQELNQES
ncbi:MAG: DsbA family protein [Chitinophagaceae bacterium]|nr:DsbA family protein [Chitinophagaceae bacterium]MCW5927401.1 DsbA family protein [Chitinophagaceae bacterium]